MILYSSITGKYIVIGVFKMTTVKIAGIIKMADDICKKVNAYRG